MVGRGGRRRWIGLGVWGIGLVMRVVARAKVDDDAGTCIGMLMCAFGAGV